MKTPSLHLLAWGVLWLGLASLCLRGWVERLAGDVRPSGFGLVRWPLTLGLSLGFVTLAMTLIGFWRLDPLAVLAVPTLAMSSSLLIGAPGRRPAAATDGTLGTPPGARARSVLRRLLAGDVRTWATFACSLAALAVLGHATYYPFIGDDELARYAYYARLVFAQKGMSAAVRGYPLFLPMAYAYVFFTTGAVLEQLARVVPALLSAATVVATAGLCTRWYGARAGVAGALVLVASPLYLRYAPNGYVDIPSALFFVLCAYAGDVWLETRRRRWAVVAGVCAGLALWTKQAGFVALGCLGVIGLWAMAEDVARGAPSRARRTALDGALALAAAFLVGGWWFLRNVSYDGWLGAIPTPGILYDAQVRHEWTTVVPFIGYADVFGWFPSSLCLVGLAWALVRPKRGAWPLVWALSYTAVWWLRFSYDARFLLTVLPFYAALFAGAASGTKRPIPAPARWVACAAVTAAVGLAVFRAGLGGLRQWCVAPRASYAERIDRLKEGLYPTVEFLRDHVPATARLVTMDSRMPYYLMERRIRVAYPRRMEELAADDYLVAAAWGPSVYAGLGAADNEVLRALSDPAKLEKVYASPARDFAVFRVRKR